MILDWQTEKNLILTLILFLIELLYIPISTKLYDYEPNKETFRYSLLST